MQPATGCDAPLSACGHQIRSSPWYVNAAEDTREGSYRAPKYLLRGSKAAHAGTCAEAVGAYHFAARGVSVHQRRRLKSFPRALSLLVSDGNDLLLRRTSGPGRDHIRPCGSCTLIDQVTSFCASSPGCNTNARLESGTRKQVRTQEPASLTCVFTLEFSPSHSFFFLPLPLPPCQQSIKQTSKQKRSERGPA